MKRRALGHTGRTVSAIGLGCMGMSEFYGPTDEAQSQDAMAAALDLGIDFFDTADMYGIGENEKLVGRFLRGRRDKVVLATKFGNVRTPGSFQIGIDNSPAYIKSACEASLQRLGIDVIDLYYMHRRTSEVPIEDSVGAMAELVRQGKAKALGLSEVSVETLRRAHKIHPITAVQTEYSLWSREPEQGMLEACRALDVTFVAYSPLGRGFLTGMFKSPDSFAQGDFRGFSPRFQGEAFAQNKKLADALGDFAKSRKVTAAQLALAWVLAKAPHIVPIPGTKRRRYVAENAAAADIALSKDEVAKLDAMFPPEAVQGLRYPEVAMKHLGT
jgi:aryl-alcohol dehydrogenase-like predicted oxidoreductase